MDGNYIRGLRAEFYPRMFRKFKGGVCLLVPCLYQLVRINFYVKLSGQSKCFDFRFGAFCFLYEPYPPILRVIFWPIKMFGWKIRVLAKKMYVAYEPSPLVVKMIRNPLQFDAF